jgi:hypothetical protein
LTLTGGFSTFVHRRFTKKAVKFQSAMPAKIFLRGLLFFLLWVSFSFNSCILDLEPDSPIDTVTPGDTGDDDSDAGDTTADNEAAEIGDESPQKANEPIQKFYVPNLDAGPAYYRITAMLLAENDDCLVYAEMDSQGNPVIAAVLAEEIAREYSGTIYPLISGAFGEAAHVTGLAKTTLLLVDIQDGYDPKAGGAYVGGLFNPQDMEQGYYSNQRDMLYLDTSPGLQKMPSFYATVAHELQHLINYSNSVMVNGGRPMDLWIDEGLSTAAEYLYAGDPSGRVSYYAADPRKTIVQGNNFFVWYGKWETGPAYDDPVANYATAYLFFQWLRIQSGGVGIYQDIIKSGYTNYRAVTGAARAAIPDLGLSSDTDWEPLLRTWHLANLINNSLTDGPDRIYGYQGQIGEITGGKISQLNIHYLTSSMIPLVNGKKQITLAPGEGVYSRILGASYSPPDGSGIYIRYAGVDTDGSITPTTAMAPYAGESLLTFNADSSAGSSGGIGFYAETLTADPAGARTAAPADGPPAAYPIDGGAFLERRDAAHDGP